MRRTFLLILLILLDAAVAPAMASLRLIRRRTRRRFPGRGFPRNGKRWPSGIPARINKCGDRFLALRAQMV